MTSENPRLTPDELREAGEALFGERWQTSLAAALGVHNSSRIREFLRGDRQIPAGIRGEIINLLRNAAQKARDVADKLEQGTA